LSAKLEWARLPLLPGVSELAQSGHTTGASLRNWESYGNEIQLDEGLSAWQQAVLSDPQTSGGLLVSCAAESRDAVLEIFRRQGFAHAAEIGRLEAGSNITVTV
jgi:selenide,water dikinase